MANNLREVTHRDFSPSGPFKSLDLAYNAYKRQLYGKATKKGITPTAAPKDKFAMAQGWTEGK